MDNYRATNVIFSFEFLNIYPFIAWRWRHNSELTNKIGDLESSLSEERDARERAETRLEEVEFELAENQAGDQNSKKVDDETGEQFEDDSNNEYLLGEIEDLKERLNLLIFCGKSRLFWVTTITLLDIHYTVATPNKGIYCLISNKSFVPKTTMNTSNRGSFCNTCLFVFFANWKIINQISENFWVVLQ